MEYLTPVKELIKRSLDFFGVFLIALVIFVVGWIVAKIIRALVERLLRVLRLDMLAEQVKIADFLSKGGIKLTLSEIIGLIIYWVIILGVLISSLNTLSLTGVTSFLDKILAYVPLVIGALIILVLGIFISVFVSSIVRTATANIGVTQANLLSKVAQVAIIVFTILIALDQLQVGAVLVAAMNIVLAAIGLAVALAFGLGCRDIAARFVQDMIDKLRRK